MIRIALLCAFAFALRAQEFEAASIRPPSNTPAQCNGGPGTKDPGLLTCNNFPLSWSTMMAYNVRPFEFSGPAWMLSTRFDVRATLPTNAGAEQFRAMLRRLLSDRFKLAVHLEKKEIDGAELVVVKKSPNLRPSKNAEPAPAQPWTTPYGGPPVRAHALLTSRGLTMSGVALFASDRLNRPVADATGLFGRYDFELNYADGPPGPSLSSDDDADLTLTDALREQLGLGLVKKKVPVDIVVVDYSEKTPVEN